MAKVSSYDKEFKEGVIQYCLKHPDESYVSIGEKFNIHATTVGGWVKSYKENNDEVICRGSGNYISDEAKEIDRLKKNLRIHRMH